MKNIKIIKSNSNKEEGSFIGKLNEGEFDKVLFNSFVKCVYDVHNSEFKDTERL